VEENIFHAIESVKVESAHKRYGDKESWQKAKAASGTVLQWDPDHLLSGEKHKGRRAVQIGIRPEVVQGFFNTKECILAVEDVTAFVQEQRERKDRGESVLTPAETIYTPLNRGIVSIVGLQVDLSQEEVEHNGVARAFEQVCDSNCGSNESNAIDQGDAIGKRTCE